MLCDDIRLKIPIISWLWFGMAAYVYNVLTYVPHDNITFILCDIVRAVFVNVPRHMIIIQSGWELITMERYIGMMGM